MRCLFAGEVVSIFAGELTFFPGFAFMGDFVFTGDFTFFLPQILFFFCVTLESEAAWPGLRGDNVLFDSDFFEVLAEVFLPASDLAMCYVILTRF